MKQNFGLIDLFSFVFGEKNHIQMTGMERMLLDFCFVFLFVFSRGRH